MKAFRELGLYGERRRGQLQVDIADVFPGIYQLREIEYEELGGLRRCSLGVYLTQLSPPAVITVEQASNTRDGFTSIRMKVVSPEPEKVVEQIKTKAPYFSDYEFPLASVAAG